MARMLECFNVSRIANGNNSVATLDAIDRNRPQKLYCQVAELLKSNIEKGQWAVGAQVPTEDHLCRLYDVSKATVRLAVEELVSLGYLKKFQGKGTFVRRRNAERSILMLTNLAENGTCRNPSCLTRLLEYRVLRPAEEVRALLNVGEDDNCHYLLSSTLKFESPYLVQRAYFPYGLLPSVLAADEAECAAREGPLVFVESKCGLKIHRLRETTDVATADAGDGALLAVEPGSQVLRARQLCSASGEVPIAYCEALFRTTTDARTVEFERPTI